jgi:hypothetical protein
MLLYGPETQTQQQAGAASDRKELGDATAMQTGGATGTDRQRDSKDTSGL